MFVVTYRKFFFILSGLLLLVSILAMWKFGFNVGIDFEGGTITEVSYPAARPEQTVLAPQIDKLELGNYILQPSGDNSYVVKTKELDEKGKQALLAVLVTPNSGATVDRYDSIGPIVGSELKKKSFTAIAVVILCIVLFITYAFRKVSEPVASWKFGLATIISLAHDVIIPTGIFAIYAYFTGAEIDVLFVSALLAVLGYSVHDTIVVFDRIREHLRINKEKHIKENFDITVGKSVSETFGRSINTSVTIFLVLIILFFLGGSTTRDFAFVLLMGIIAGTYSSIFVASPLLVLFEKIQNKNKAKR